MLREGGELDFPPTPGAHRASLTLERWRYWCPSYVEESCLLQAFCRETQDKGSDLGKRFKFTHEYDKEKGDEMKL